MENFPTIGTQILHLYGIIILAVIYVMAGMTLFMILSEYQPKESFLTRLAISIFWPLAFFYLLGRRIKGLIKRLVK